MSRFVKFGSLAVLVLVVIIAGCSDDDDGITTPEKGTIVIDQSPDVLEGAGWSLSGPQNETGSGDVTFNNMPVGSYTLGWDAVSGYTPPSSSTQTLTDDGTITFSGTYAEAENIIWEDGFETYSSNTWPSSWVADGNGTDGATNYVDATIYSSGSKSLKLYGSVGGCWGAIAYRSITVTAPFQIEVKVRNGNEALSGCHPYGAYIGLRQGTSWTNPARGLILFDGAGSIYSNGSCVSGTVLESGYSNLTWYTVRILYERPSSTEVRISYWINGVSKGSETFSAIAEEALLTNLDLETQEGTVWFDDVKVIK